MGFLTVPIGGLMAEAKRAKSAQPTLAKVRPEEPPAIKEVKTLIPDMCHIDPKKRPKAVMVADALVVALGI